MRLLFLDTETTGIPDWPKPSDDPHQARIMQLAVLSYDDARLIVAHCWLIKPEDWPEPQAEALAIHGITVEECEQHGYLWDDIWGPLAAMITRADKMVMFGANFDRRMIRIELKRRNPGHAAWFKERPFDCAMLQATKVMGLGPSEKMSAAGRHYNKTASLAEAFEFVMGRPFKQSHNALIDALACARVYLEMITVEAGETEPKPLL